MSVAVVVLPEFRDHFCGGRDCGKARVPCDLCLAQRRYKSTVKLLADGKPTLAHRPFAGLAKRGEP